MHNESWIVFSAITDKFKFSRAFYFSKIPQKWLASWLNSKWVDYYPFDFVIVWFNLHAFKLLGTMDK